MFSKLFWKDTFERAVKTAAQFGIGALGADFVNIFTLTWESFAGALGAGAVLSLLTSLASGYVGPKDSPSLVVEPKPEA
jgi:hypothetical protein